MMREGSVIKRGGRYFGANFSCSPRIDIICKLARRHGS